MGVTAMGNAGEWLLRPPQVVIWAAAVGVIAGWLVRKAAERQRKQARQSGMPEPASEPRGAYRQSRRREWGSLGIALGTGVAVWALSMRLVGRAPELTAAVTTVYAALVYFQLRQRWAELRDEREREYARRPILQLGPFRKQPPYFRLAPEVSPGTGLGLCDGCYITIPLKNAGRTLTRACQALITACAERSGGTWHPDANWVPLPLVWTLDELDARIQGGPTRERDLIPERP
jgi:hypothetical protein